MLVRRSESWFMQAMSWLISCTSDGRTVQGCVFLRYVWNWSVPPNEHFKWKTSSQSNGFPVDFGIFCDGTYHPNIITIVDGKYWHGNYHISSQYYHHRIIQLHIIQYHHHISISSSNGYYIIHYIGIQYQDYP